MGRNQIAKTLGRSPAWVTKHLNGTPSKYYTQKANGSFDLPGPKFADQLEPEALKALEDFRYFRNRYFERETPNFQVQVADRVTALEPEESLLAFWPPGHGKTTTMTHDYPIWRMLRARCYGKRFSCLLISKGEGLGRAFLRRISRTLENNTLLQEEFGWFKPEHPDMWTQAQLQVDGFDAEQQGKEPTFVSAGTGSNIYGWRVDLIICDDLIDNETGRNSETMDKLQEWFHEIVESRLEKGASLVVCGTRFHMQDLYGRLLGLFSDDGQEMYSRVLFPAHDETLCPGPDGPHLEYPDGCLLWPSQKTYQSLMKSRSKMGTARFDFVYNQVESSDEDNLLKSEWIEQAKDPNRVLWHIPPRTRVVCTLDPSPTAYACAQCWAYDQANNRRYLVAIERKRMTVEVMIRLMEEWTLKLRDLGKEPSWFFERNAAQRWLLQSLDYKQLRQRININVHSHDTHRNKADPQYGVQILAPLYEYGQVSLPWGNPESRKALQFFLAELLAYPNGSTDDGVMAEWFFEWNLRKVMRSNTQSYVDYSWAPDYLKDVRKIVYIGERHAS